MKNDWQLVAHLEKIWVQVLRIKYKVGLHLMPDVNPSTRLSPIWRAICKVWPSVFHNIGWVMNNGEWVRFWKDAWIPGMRDLESTFPQIVPPGEDHFPVSYDVHDREWKWDTLQRFLPGHVCTLIASTKPPQAGVMDTVTWFPSPDGTFTLKSAYTLLQYSEDEPPASDPLFTKIWKWGGGVPNALKLSFGSPHMVASSLMMNENGDTCAKRQLAVGVSTSMRQSPTASVIVMTSGNYGRR